MFSISLLCNVLKIPRSLYYYHIKEKYSVRNERMTQFKCLIKAIYHQHNGIYGAHKIHAVLINKGYVVSIKYVQKIMRLLGIMSVTVKKFKHYTKSKVKGIFNNILNQDFKALEPNKKWVADITYIQTKKHGWCYLSSIIDLYSRKVIAH